MSEQMISGYVFDPSTTSFNHLRKAPAECVTIWCSRSEFCGLLKRGQCLCSNLNRNSCPYGRVQREVGPTSKSKSFYGWVLGQMRMLQGVRQLSRTSSELAVVGGDLVFLPYITLNWSQEHPVFPGRSFDYLMDLSDFNVEALIQICEYRPHDAMGKPYPFQREVLPQILRHVSAHMPELFQTLCAVYPSAAMLL